jgi:hypothetical protein
MNGLNRVDGEATRASPIALCRARGSGVGRRPCRELAIIANCYAAVDISSVDGKGVGEEVRGTEYGLLSGIVLRVVWTA